MLHDLNLLFSLLLVEYLIREREREREKERERENKKK